MSDIFLKIRVDDDWIIVARSKQKPKVKNMRSTALIKTFTPANRLPMHPSGYEILTDIIENERITTVFQPIIDLQTGKTFAVEALSRVIGPSPITNLDDLFEEAQRCNITYRLEKLCRKKALINAHLQKIDVPITINVCPSVLKCKEHEEGITSNLVDELFDYRDKVILELTERHFIKDHILFEQTVEYYRRQGFKIAIDDLGAGYTGLKMLTHIEPYMVKIDRSLISNIDKSPKKRMLIEAFVPFCNKINSFVVAEGIETERELDLLISLKVDFGQGYYLAYPEPEVPPISEKADNRIRKLQETPELCWLNKDISNCVESLVQVVEPVLSTQPVSDVIDRFKQDHSLTCLPVVENHIPLGIINKSRLFFKLGQRFGYDLFSRKQVSEVMESAMVFESGALLEDVSRNVVKRDENQIYDAVVITYNESYLGVVKIHHLLERITEQKINMATQANPLSNLPGNNLIKEEILHRLNRNQIFTVLYFDLDNFKPFNDNFGFEQGDRVLRFLGNFLKEQLSAWDLKGFIGHIGGDDFVAICRNQDIEVLCHNIIENFDHKIKEFHDDISVRSGFYTSINRKGESQNFHLLSLSIAVVSNSNRHFSSYGQLVSIASEVKKKAKKTIGSSYYIDLRSM